jgi:hypothetical protein
MINPKARPTISIYAEDRDWLQQRQREINFKRGSWITMHELVHELIMAIRLSESEA